MEWVKIYSRIFTDNKSRDLDLQTFKLFIGLLCYSNNEGLLEADLNCILHNIDYTRSFKNVIESFNELLNRNLLQVVRIDNKYYLHLINKSKLNSYEYRSKEEKRQLEVLEIIDVEDISNIFKSFENFSKNCKEFITDNKRREENKREEKREKRKEEILINGLSVDNFLAEFKQAWEGAGLPAIIVWNKERRDKMIKLFTEKPEWVKHYKAVIRAVSKNDWWVGKSKDTNEDHKNWRATVDYFLTEYKEKPSGYQRAWEIYEQNNAYYMEERISRIKEIEKSSKVIIPNEIKENYLKGIIPIKEVREIVQEIKNNTKTLDSFIDTIEEGKK